MRGLEFLYLNYNEIISGQPAFVLVLDTVFEIRSEDKWCGVLRTVVDFMYKGEFNSTLSSLFSNDWTVFSSVYEFYVATVNNPGTFSCVIHSYETVQKNYCDSLSVIPDPDSYTAKPLTTAHPMEVGEPDKESCLPLKSIDLYPNELSKCKQMSVMHSVRGSPSLTSLLLSDEHETEK